MSQMKTPGVYIVEKNAFGNAVVEVATAVPAFIGYTEKAEFKGKNLTNIPTRITSLTEFIQHFGQGPATAFAFAKEAEGAKPEDLTEVTSKVMFNSGKDVYSITPPAKQFQLYSAMRHFYLNGGGPCYIVSVGDYSAAPAADALSKGFDPLVKEQEPTLLLCPDAMVVPVAGCQTIQQAMLAQCGNMKNRFAMLDVFNGFTPPADSVETFRNNIGTNFLEYSAAYYPWLNTTVIQPSEVSFLNIDPVATLKKELEDGFTASLTAGSPPAEEGKPPELTDAQKAAKASFEKLLTDMEAVAAAAKKGPLSQEDQVKLKQTNSGLMSTSPLFKMVMEQVQKRLNLLPPSAAMAGIYTMVDSQIGVWKAPANVSVNSVSSPSVNIDFAEQQDLNAPINGKAVNAIRAFIGEGVLVWGARTLDANSLDWRYINVRRTMIMLEESIRLASQAYVFEPNTADTWTTMKSMISNFLQSIWKQGGLAGATPAEAFSVQVGLGSTMTGEDILEGIMRITVLVAISHPAEFIEITFEQQMQKS